MVRRIKYFDLSDHGSFERSLVVAEEQINGKYPHAMALLTDAADGKLYFKGKSFMLNIFSKFYPVELVIDGEAGKSTERFYRAAKSSKKYGVWNNDTVHGKIRNAKGTWGTEAFETNR